MIRKTIIFTFFIYILQISMLHGHAPSNVILEFDKETHILEVKFDHNVRDIVQHYVEEVNVLLNGKEIIIQTLNRQDNVNGGLLVYKIIDAKPDDRIRVQLKCSRGGNKSDVIQVE